MSRNNYCAICGKKRGEYDDHRCDPKTIAHIESGRKGTVERVQPAPSFARRLVDGFAMLGARCVLVAALIFIATRPAAAIETFEQAWQSRWRPQVAGSFMSRRFEPQIKGAAREIWDVAQQNVPAGGAPKAVQPAQPASGFSSPAPQRRRFRFFRRRGLFR